MKIRLVHTSAFSKILSAAPGLRSGPESEPSTIPNQLEQELFFTVVHPFHPLHAQKFILLAQRVTYGEPRVFFKDPSTAHIRSLPTAWTDQASPDPFYQLASERAILSLVELRKLAQLLEDFRSKLKSS